MGGETPVLIKKKKQQNANWHSMYLEKLKRIAIRLIHCTSVARWEVKSIRRLSFVNLVTQSIVLLILMLETEISIMIILRKKKNRRRSS